MNEEEFFSIWRKSQNKSTPQPCPIATEFRNKLQDVVFAPLSSVSISRSRIAQAKYMLQEEYHSWKKSVTPEHRSCIAEVYDESYDRLHLMELTRRPATNVIIDYEEITKPAPPPPAPPVVHRPRQVGGLFIGEEDE